MNRKQILEEAIRIVCGGRNYGTPEDNFGVVAQLWSVYIDAPVSAEDVSAMQIMLKLARVKTGVAKDDNWIDIAGYAACGGEIGGIAE